MTEKTELQKQVEGATIHNAATPEVAIESYDQKNNTIKAVVVTGNPIRRVLYSGDSYVLKFAFAPENVDLSRYAVGAPFVIEHQADVRVQLGAIVKAELDSKKERLIATIKLSQNPYYAGFVSDIKAGICRNVSLGAHIHQTETLEPLEDGTPVLLATLWQPIELSLVAIPADKDAQIFAEQSLSVDYPTTVDPQKEAEENQEPQRKDSKMSEKEAKENPVATQPPEKIDGSVEAVREERLRSAEITKICLKAGAVDMVDDLISSGVSLADARSRVLDRMISNQPSIAVNATTTRDASEKFAEAAVQSISARAGLEKRDDKNEYNGIRLIRLAEECVVRNGGTVRGKSDLELVRLAFHTTSDFPQILASAVEKSLQKGYETTDESWRLISRSVPVSDFKPQTMVGGGEFSDLDELKGAQEYRYGTFADTGESIKLSTYGKLFAVTRQVIINDDLGYLTDTPKRMGAAASRKISDLVWGVLTANATMADGNQVFSVAHANTGTGVVGVAGLDTAKVAMATQKDISGKAALGIRGKNLIVPVSKETTAMTLMVAVNDPDLASKVRPNAFANAYTVVSNPRLDAADTNAWYIQADPNVIDTIIVGFLGGNETPYLDQQDTFNVDGVVWKVRIDAGAKVVGYRGLYRSTGV